MVNNTNGDFMYMFLKYGLTFLVGGGTYCMVELLTRARTHYSMFFCGGLSILILYAVYYNNKSINPFLFGLIAAIVITSLEFLFGIVFNILLSLNVWDYSNLPFNLFGQISVPFSIIWYFAGIGLYLIFSVIKI